MATATVPRTVLVVPCAATLLALMNYTAPLSTLPATAAGLRAGPTAQIWILSSISLGLAAVLLAVGALADDHGRRRVFLAGAALLAAASAVCAAAPDPATFVAGRIMQGVASAALLATSLGVIGHSFRAGHQRARATGIWGAMLGAGIALGPIVTSVLTDAVSWRLWYWLAAAGSLALVAAGWALPESRADRRTGLDLPGVATLSTGVAALLAGITVGRGGWLRVQTLALFGLAALLLAAFALIESRRRRPMLDLALLRRPSFVLSLAGALFTGLSVIGLMSYLTTVMHLAMGLTVVAAALILAVWSGLSFAVALQARRVAHILSGRHQVTIGLLLSAAGELTLLGLAPDTRWWRMVPGLAVAGVGSGLLNAALARVAVESVPVDRASMGSAANNTARYVGASIGVAIVAMVATNAHAGSPKVALTHGTNIAIVLCAGLAVLGAAVALLARDRPQEPTWQPVALPVPAEEVDAGSIR